MQKAAPRTGTKSSKQRKETQETTKHQTLTSKEDMRRLSKCQLIPQTGQSKGLRPIQQAG